MNSSTQQISGKHQQSVDAKRKRFLIGITYRIRSIFEKEKVRC